MYFGILNVIYQPFNPQIDQHLISPYHTTPQSHIKVTRIKEIINN